MSTKTQKAGDPAPREYDVTLGIRTAKRGKIKFIGNPRTLQEWKWTEREQPGLYDFLRGLLRGWHRPAVTGKKFTAGRKSGTGGPIRKTVARLLKKNHSMKNPELWAAVIDKPPRDWIGYDDRKLLEGPGIKTMTQGRFYNVCADERKKLQR